MPTFDVVVHMNSGVFLDGAQRLLESFPPVTDRIEMERGLWLRRLDTNFANALMDTCDPKLLGVPTPVRQYGQMFAYGRDPCSLFEFLGRLRRVSCGRADLFQEIMAVSGDLVSAERQWGS